MKKIARLFGLGVLSITALSSFTSCGRTGFKVGLLCLHGQTSTYDNNFIQAFEKACEKCGLTKDQYDIRTDVAEDYNKIYTAAKEWAEDGYAMVAADSFGHQYGLIDVAKEYPDTEFFHATGTLCTVNPDVKNFHNGFASIYEGRYLAGVVAGQRMKKDIAEGKYTADKAVIGYVGAWPYAEVISGYTSFYLGARSICPSVTMKVKYTSSWYDFRAEKDAAESLINQGCKLISQHADSMGAPLACNQNGIPNVCYNISTKGTCANTYLAASKINWEPYFERAIIQSRKRYNKEPYILNSDYCGSLHDESVVLMDDYVAEDKNQVEQIKDDLKNGKTHVFDTSKFTVTKTDKRNPFANIKLDSDGHLLEYYPDVIDKGDYKSDHINVVANDEEGNKYVSESYVVDANKEPLETCRSAPYFDLIIDGIETLN